MPILNDVLGMNARNLHYLRLNKKYGRKIADSKLFTKKLLKKHRINHPQLITQIKSYADINHFDWLSLREGFVIKPSEGLGGEGVLVVRQPATYAGEWLLMDGSKVNISDLKLHTADIVEGRYSRNRTPDEAFIEERVKIHPKFSKYAFQGTPDVRIIVYNHIPVMAMLRLPTKESGGKANIHQGAIGVGIDMATGITTSAVYGDSLITYLPGTDRKVNGIRIPLWEDALKMAVDVQRSSRLGYVGVDIVIDVIKGPLVLEFNHQPGLQIQLANKAGLLRRLKRVEGLKINSRYKGVQIAQVLFAESFSDKVKIKEGQRIVGIFEKVELIDSNKGVHTVIAKMDTGALNVSIDRQLADELGLLKPENILYETKVKSSLGKQSRLVIEVDMILYGRKVRALATVANRKNLKAPLLIGRRYLKGFMVDPAKLRGY